MGKVNPLLLYILPPVLPRLRAQKLTNLRWILDVLLFCAKSVHIEGQQYNKIDHASFPEGAESRKLNANVIWVDKAETQNFVALGMSRNRASNRGDIRVAIARNKLNISVRSVSPHAYLQS